MVNNMTNPEYNNYYLDQHFVKTKISTDVKITSSGDSCYWQSHFNLFYSSTTLVSVR